MSEIEDATHVIKGVKRSEEMSFDTDRMLADFLSRVLKEPLEVAYGLIRGKLRFARRQGLLRTAEEVSRLLGDRGLEDTRGVPPNIALPLLEESSFEDNNDIHALWNKLLANAMDPGFAREIRRAYMDILRGLTVLDTRILEAMYRILIEKHPLHFRLPPIAFSVKELSISLEIPEFEYLTSIHNLMRMQCLETYLAPVIFGSRFSSEPFLVSSGAEEVVLTPLGFRFIEACLK